MMRHMSAWWMLESGVTVGKNTVHDLVVSISVKAYSVVMYYGSQPNMSSKI